MKKAHFNNTLKPFKLALERQYWKDFDKKIVFRSQAFHTTNLIKNF